MAHKRGSVYHEGDYLSGPTKYLGRFAGKKVLREGHNTDPVSKITPGRPRPTRRSDTPLLDKSLREEQLQRTEEETTVPKMLEIPAEDVKRRRKLFIST